MSEYSKLQPNHSLKELKAIAQPLPEGVEKQPFIREYAEELLNEKFSFNDQIKEFLADLFLYELGGYARTFSQIHTAATRNYEGDGGFPLEELRYLLDKGYRYGILFLDYQAPDGVYESTREVFYGITSEARILFKDQIEADPVVLPPHEGFVGSVLLQYQELFKWIGGGAYEEDILDDLNPQLYDQVKESIHDAVSEGLVTRREDELGGFLLTLSPLAMDLLESSSTAVSQEVS